MVLMLSPSQVFDFLIVTILILYHCNGYGASRNASIKMRNSRKDELNIKRCDFENDFLFGAATSALQIEGSSGKFGKGPSIWDDYFDKYPNRVKDGSSPKIAIDSYVRYKDDVKLLKELGMDAYRFSISWTRILPGGSLKGGVNQQGIDHYNDLINGLIDHGIQPFVTLFHFDSPQVLQEQYGGFLSRKIIDDFKDYAEICFKTYGDRVKKWITINEPSVVAQYGYELGLAAPGRCSFPPNTCNFGNSSTEPYIAAHNLLLAHAAATNLYKHNFQIEQKGEIGISLVGEFFKPYSKSSSEDKQATNRAFDFNIGWFLGPLVYGVYPISMRKLVKERLPRFSEEDRNLVKGSFDFIGINYYTSRYVKAVPIDPHRPLTTFSLDSFTSIRTTRHGVPIGEKKMSMLPLSGVFSCVTQDGFKHKLKVLQQNTFNWMLNWTYTKFEQCLSVKGSFYLYVYPIGLKKLLLYTKRNYKINKFYITENGISETNKKRNHPIKLELEDPHRVDFILRHLYQIKQSIKKGVEVKGYFYWSPFDSFEFGEGHRLRYGLYYTDYNNNFTRVPKYSAIWLPSFLRCNISNQPPHNFEM